MIMMKKIFNIAVTFAALTLALGACAPTEIDDIFDESAATRLDKAITEYKDYFTANGGKWELLYFANTEEHGFYFVVTFHNDGSVDIAGDNKFMTGSSSGEDVDMSKGYIKDTSLWEVQGDDGPSISFCSLNEAFHFFCDPGIIPPGASRANGAGHEGDFEFNVLSREENSCVLRGKKHGLLMTMNRLPADTDDEAWVEQGVANESNYFALKVNTLYMTCPSGKRFILSDYEASLPGNQSMTPDLRRFLWLFVPEGGDAVSEREHATLMLTPTGIHFYEPLEFLSEYDASANAVQDFYFQEDGTLLADDGVTKITGPALFDFFTDKARTWRISLNESDRGGKLGDLLAAAQAGFPAFNKNTSLTYLDFLWITSLQRPGMLLRLKLKSGNLNSHLFTNIEKVGENEIKINMSSTDGETGAMNYCVNVPAFGEFVNYIGSQNLVMSVDNVLMPSKIKLAEKSAPNSFVYVTLR